jgi:two-component system, NarL family, response regulator NreC
MTGDADGAKMATGTTSISSPESPVADDVIRVLLVDDHRMMRTGLRLILERVDGIRCVGEAETTEEAVRACERVTPDVVVMDLETQGLAGGARIREMRTRRPEMGVVVLSMDADGDDVRSAFASGAQGYLLKTAADGELVDAIRAVGAGERYLHPSLGAALAQPAPPDPLDVLTDREREVLQLLALGYGNQEIAARLHLSPRTVETHRANMMSKLHLTTRADIVRVALRSGLLGVPEPAAGGHSANGR